MKKTILFTISLFALIFNIEGQITINKSHIINSGQLTVQAYDNDTFVHTSGGANKVWDFSTLVENDADSISFGQSQWYLGYTNYPGANLASTYYAYDSSYDYYTLNDTVYSYLGTYEVNNGEISVYKNNYKLLTFPSTFNTTYTYKTSEKSGSMEVGTDPDGPGPAPFIDSVSYTTDNDILSLIDGYGTIKTPLGNYSCLRQNIRTITSIGNVKMFSGGSWKTIPPLLLKAMGYNTKPDTSYTISFWTNDASIGMPVVQYYYTEGDKTIDGVTWTQIKLQASSIKSLTQLKNISSYPNPCHSVLTVSLPVSVKSDLTIFDLNGKMVDGLLVENGSVIDISKYENGLYLLRYKDINTGETIHTQKILKY